LSLHAQIALTTIPLSKPDAARFMLPADIENIQSERKQVYVTLEKEISPNFRPTIVITKISCNFVPQIAFSQ
jgi:hypothetical protein